MLSLIVNNTDLTEYLAPQGLKRNIRLVSSSVVTMDGTEHIAKIATKYDWTILFRALTTEELAIVEGAFTEDASFEALIEDPYKGEIVSRLKMPDRPMTYLGSDGDDYWMPSEITCREL